LDIDKQKIYVDKKEIQITKNEFELAKKIFEENGRLVSREILMKQVI
jgi:DNA-binding response OmpR family regulator